MKKLLIRITQWEYWPFHVLYFPAFLYYGWLVIKHRSFFFFTAANPRIESGGMFGEKKSDIFQLIPQAFIPRTKKIYVGDVAKATAAAHEIGFPLIAKPDIGERGAWVSQIQDQKALVNYVETCPVDFLLQEMVTLPLELGIFYVKYPEEKGRITSIVRKGFLSVTGDGKSSIENLLLNNPRALMMVDFESDHLRTIKHCIPKLHESVLVEPIGNHCRGTEFLNDNHQIDKELNAAFNKLAEQIPDFYFGRFDLKCNSYEELRKLQNFKILELNGAGSEPGHIYHPGYSLWKAYRDIFWHLGVLSDISASNRKKGHTYWTFKQGLKKWKSYQKHNRLLSHP